MNWALLLIVAAVVAGYLYVRTSGQISTEQACDLIKKGALIIDVRTPAEFASEHLPNVMNVPLGEVSDRASTAIPDKTAPVLLHCHSGGRSLVAQRWLRRLGYENVHNLGSYSRAKSILNQARQ
jgi:phage shock protein E